MKNMPVEKAYRVLARKYRPQNFSDLIGQEVMVRTLTNAFQTGRIAQAWILTGIRGVGKTTTARILARALNYKTQNINQPTTILDTFGEHCKQIIEGCHLDVIEMDAASHTGIDDIREIIEQIRYRPVSARYKVYIIDEVHMLSTQAFNGLLKTLEEPPLHVKFIFATTEIRKVPITILSRCQRFDLRRIESTVLIDHLRQIAKHENIEVENSALSMIARAAEGSVRDALSIFDQAIAHSNGHVSATAVRAMLGLADQARIIDLFEFIMKGDVVNALHELRSQYDAGANLLTIITDLADFNHLVTRLRFTPDLAESFLLSEDERLRSLDFSQKLPVPILSRNWQMLLKGLQEINQTTRPLQAAEMLLIRLTHTTNFPTLDEAFKKLTQEKEPLTITSNVSYQESKNTNNKAEEAIYPYSTQCVANTPPPQAQPNLKEPLKNQLRSALQHQDSLKVQDSKNISSFKITKNPEPLPSSTIFEDTKNLSYLPTHAVEETSENKKIVINSLHDIVKLAEQHNEISFKLFIKEFVHPVLFESEHITLKLSENAPPSLPRDIEKMLFKWTQKRWTISLVNEGGGPTLNEESDAAEKSLFSNVQADPKIAKILNHFPDSKIIGVRFNKQENELDLSPDAFKNMSNINNK
ncbi:DNA polymerase III subunit gamma/tau [Bartonella sp. CB189]|uniref:DNA polymerase III subunit gamma/tau n=1 Tax=Bartonella sp. CB189 TaxID=3112254 RepID=UPI002F969729